MDESAAAEGVSVRNAHGKESVVLEELARLAAVGADVLKIMKGRYLDRVKPPGSVSIVLVDDETITRVHGEFMGDESATDVITFPYGDHGEIPISLDTAVRQASEFQASLSRELALYVVHGILHLCGYEDESEAGREAMEGLQEALLDEVLSGD